ncbi:hypothetical protein BGZ80_001262 [Entomortierella chlamydospora]|uniref:Uncharacterized protein n=1 Tax=Entomortierella chlamydospora TaxID=101097 RepID=A0A9P6MRU6_9FUNG|nr:hypothetical protein BGZ80_001262 [Entomortierella chlamydospora]
MSFANLPISPPRSMPPECLERIVYHASQDHRTLSTLMQVNSTLFRMATPYLYHEPFNFIFGDEFMLDWDTATWTRHLREVRHAKLLLLYLSCSDLVQSMLSTGKGQGLSSRRNSETPAYWDCKDPTRNGNINNNNNNGNTNNGSNNNWRQGHSSSHPTLLEPDTDLRSTPSSPPMGRIPTLLEKLLREQCLRGGGPTSSSSLVSPLRLSMSVRQKTSTSNHAGKKVGVNLSGLSVNYLDYVEHLDLDTFLSTSIQVLFSPSSSARNEHGCGTLKIPSYQHHSSTAKLSQYSMERAFVERALLRSMAQHITTLSVSVATFVRLQRDLMEHVLEPTSPSPPCPSSSSPQGLKNSAGIRTGMPLSQLSRLNISGLHAELKPKVLRAIRWFLRRHVVVYPGMLKAIAFEGPGDIIVNRRRQRNRNVVAVEPVQPGVVHFNNQHADDDTTDEIEEEQDHVAPLPQNNTLTQLQQLQQQQQQQQQNQNQHHIQHQHQHFYQHQHQNQIHNQTQNHNHNQHGNTQGLFVDGAGYVNNVPPNNTTAVPAEALPAVFHSQYYLLRRNPDESSEVDFMGIIQELHGQLEVVDLSQWSWSVITQQALDMIPVAKLSTLRFHPRTRIQWHHGPSFLSDCPALKVLEIHAFDPAMLDLVGNIGFAPSVTVQNHPSSSPSSSSLSSIDPPPPPPRPSYPASLNTLSLTGSVPNVLPAVRDAIRIMGKSLDTINLSAHLDGFLSDKQTHELMDWSTSLSTTTIPQLTTLQLHGHLALSFDAPLLLELCPTLRHFSLAIKSYTSTSFVSTESARVLPRFMIPWEGKDLDEKEVQKFQLRVLELQGPWILTRRDMHQIGEQICGLVTLNLVGCRFYSSTTRRQVEILPDSGDDSSTFGGDDERDEGETDDNISSVERLVEKIQGTLRTLRIHRRGLEPKPRRDSYDYSSYSSIHSNATSPNLHCLANGSAVAVVAATAGPLEPVLAFKKRFPNVSLQIQEKQHEHSFVIAPSADILRRIHRPNSSQGRRSSLSLADIWDHAGPGPAQHQFGSRDSVWRRARDAMPFLKSFGEAARLVEK